MEFYFFEDKLAHSPLNAHRQELIWVQLLVWPLSRRGPQERVIAREQHLEEVVIIKLAIAVEVEVVHHEYEVFG